MKPFVRKVKTFSGATAVQIVHKQGRKVVDLEHVGSAHDEAELAALLDLSLVSRPEIFGLQPVDLG